MSGRAKGGGFASTPDSLIGELIQQLTAGAFSTAGDPVDVLVAMVKAEHAAASSDAAPNPVELTFLCLEANKRLDVLKDPKITGPAQHQAVTELVAIFGNIEALWT